MIRRPPSSTLFPSTTPSRSPRHRQVEPQWPRLHLPHLPEQGVEGEPERQVQDHSDHGRGDRRQDRKSTRLNSSHANISYAVFCLKKKQTALAPARLNHHPLA